MVEEKRVCLWKKNGVSLGLFYDILIVMVRRVTVSGALELQLCVSLIDSSSSNAT